MILLIKSITYIKRSLVTLNKNKTNQPKDYKYYAHTRENHRGLLWVEEKK